MPLLQTRRLTAFYGDFQALFGIDPSLDAGETVAIIGANGAGKSTFLKAIAGLIRAPADSVRFDGEPIGARAAGRHRAARHRDGAGRAAAVSLADGRGEPADRRLRPQDAGPWTLERVYALFPILKERRALPRRRRCRAASSRWSRSAAR